MVVSSVIAVCCRLDGISNMRCLLDSLLRGMEFVPLSLNGSYIVGRGIERVPLSLIGSSLGLIWTRLEILGNRPVDLKVSVDVLLISGSTNFSLGTIGGPLMKSG